MSPYDALLKEQANLIAERQQVKAQISAVASQIALYDTAKTLRPVGIDPTWDPILDTQGVLKGWIDPAYAAQFYK